MKAYAKIVHLYYECFTIESTSKIENRKLNYAMTSDRCVSIRRIVVPSRRSSDRKDDASNTNESNLLL